MWPLHKIEFDLPPKAVDHFRMLTNVLETKQLIRKAIN